MSPITVRFIPFASVDWGRLVQHLIASLFIAVGTAIVASPDDMTAAILPAVKLWFAAGLVYTGGYLQDAAKWDVTHPGG